MGAHALSAPSSSARGDTRPVVICGFGELGQTVANMLESPLGLTREQDPIPYCAFDLQPARIKVSSSPLHHPHSRMVLVQLALVLSKQHPLVKGKVYAACSYS